MSILKNINEGHGNCLEMSSILSPGWDWNDWVDKLQSNDNEVVIMGHSFGGSAAVSESLFFSPPASRLLRKFSSLIFFFDY